MKKKPDKGTVLKIVKIAFGALAVIFIAWYFYRNWNEFSEKITSVDLGVFAVALLFYFVYKLSLASLFHYITKINGCSISYGKALTA